MAKRKKPGKKKPSYATLERALRRERQIHSLQKVPSVQRVNDLLKERESLIKTITNLQARISDLSTFE